MTVIDKYNFELSYDYTRLSLNGEGVTVANNIAWADQHLQLTEAYDWTANLTSKTGTW